MNNTVKSTSNMELVMSEYKPNTGKAWATKAEKKQKEMERLMEFDWFQGLSEDEKMMKIPLYSGEL